MHHKPLIAQVGVVACAAMLFASWSLAAQTGSQSLGTARVPKAVVANGQPLAAGTYTLRLTADPVPPVVGQTPSESKWVEFVQSGQVRGREVAVVLSAAELAAISKGGKPAAGTAKVEILKGNEYVRVWVNRAGTHYLLHLALPPAQ